jgi:hypothetical protein
MLSWIQSPVFPRLEMTSSSSNCLRALAVRLLLPLPCVLFHHFVSFWKLLRWVSYSAATENGGSTIRTKSLVILFDVWFFCLHQWSANLHISPSRYKWLVFPLITTIYRIYRRNYRHKTQTRVMDSCLCFVYVLYQFQNRITITDDIKTVV